MQEVTARLRFITPCLGQIRRNDYDRFQRDASGAVIFMNSWWRQLLQYGARAFGKHQTLVMEIRVHPRVVGEVKRYKRYYGPHRFKEHEAFLDGDVVEVRCMLPGNLPVEDFNKLFTLAGQWRGISPYGWQDGYGQFEVENVTSMSTKIDTPG